MRLKRGVNVGNFCGRILALFVFASAIRPAGAQLTATILYPLTAPSGLLEFYSNIECDDTGQFVATVSKYGVFWAGTSSPIELNPNTNNTMAEGVAGTQQVGQNGFDAALWTGSAATYTNLNPNGFALSNALATNGSQQVGYAEPSLTSPGQNAFLWNGTAASAVILSPTGVQYSTALGTDGTQQVGSMSVGVVGGNGGYANASLWQGTAKSVVNLQPSGFIASIADGVNGGQQVGYGSPPGTDPDLSLQASNVHALMWTGTAGSYVDLNPDGWVLSEAFGTNGTQQVGAGFITEEAGQLFPTGNYQALLWSGTAASYVNLQTLLPVTDTWVSSEAYSINAAGDVFGYAVDTNGNYFAVEWSSVPEPVSGALLSVVGACLLMRRRGFHFTGC